MIIKVMAETEITTYTNSLQEVLAGRKDWLEKTELVNLKDALRTFQSSFASLYNIYLKKKLVDEDPYKQETKISELEVPDATAFNEAKRAEQLSIRLSSYDSQLDFLVNFYQLGTDFLNLERIKRIVGLIRYIDWINLSPDSQSVMTKTLAEVSLQSKAGVDPITLSIIGESLTRLSKTTVTIMNTLKNLNVYYREAYKLSIRQNITQTMSAGEANAANIKKKMPSAIPGSPFYQELIEEIIKEDYTKPGSEIRDKILKTLKVAEEKPKAEKQAVNFKQILLDGIQVIGSASIPLGEISAKLDENEAIVESRKKGFMEALKALIRQITNSEPDEVYYDLEYMDTTKGIPVKERVNFHRFHDDMLKKVKILNSFQRGPAYTKLSAMTEEQIIGYLEKNIRDVQSLHKTLGALDEYFKSCTTPAEREKIKGIKPELSTMKNSFVKANQLRHEYSAQKEEEEQLKRLGVSQAQAEASM